MSIISSGDESWEHVSNDEDDGVSVVTDVDPDRKQYAEVVKDPSDAKPTSKTPSETSDAQNS